MPTPECRPLSPADLPAWQALWDDSPRWLAQHPGYHAATGRGGPVLGVWSGTDLLLVAAFAHLPLKGVTMASAPLFASFGGPLVSSASLALRGLAAERFWRDAFEALDSVPVDAGLAEMILPPGCADARALAWRGWEARPHYNYVTRWEEDGGWRATMESSARRQERKALEAGLSATVRDAGETATLARLWRLNSRRNRLDAELAAPLEALGAWLHEIASGFVVEVAGKDGPETAALVGHDARRVYYLAGASDPNRLGSGAPTLLQAAILAEVERRGLPRCYDWVGANTPTIARFKRHFGPELEMLVAVRRTGRKARLLEAGRRLLRP